MEGTILCAWAGKLTVRQTPSGSNILMGETQQNRLGRKF